VSESDVYLFAGITGDLHPNHVDQAYMQRTPYKERIAHGALVIGYTSAASTRFCERLQREHPELVFVSYGYDRIRFIKPVLLGDTITVSYRLERVEADEGKLFAGVRITNQRGELVAIATHILKALEMEEEDA
jgi:acyl dehydratase